MTFSAHLPPSGHKKARGCWLPGELSAGLSVNPAGRPLVEQGAVYRAVDDHTGAPDLLAEAGGDLDVRVAQIGRAHV